MKTAYVWHYESPLGRMTLGSDGTSLTGLWFDVQERYANPLIVPCHRVVGAGGALTGYAGGLDRKAYLLRLEGAML